MKIELDFESKEITVKRTVNAEELFNALKDLGLNPKEWSLKQEVIDTGITWPTIYPQPYYQPCDGTGYWQIPNVTITSSNVHT